MLTWRTAVIVGMLILAFAVVAPAVRAYLDQQVMLEGLRADAEVAQAEVDDLNAEVARWDDPAYLEAQARERLAYVFPGETPYRVVDPETAVDPEAGADAEAGETAKTGLEPWYDTLWESMTRDDSAAADDSAQTDSAPQPEPTQGEKEPLTDVDFGG